MATATEPDYKNNVMNTILQRGQLQFKIWMWNRAITSERVRETKWTTVQAVKENEELTETPMH